MKFYIKRGEWYPVYTLHRKQDFIEIEIEISEADYADYKRVMKEFDDWQDRLEKIYGKDRL